MGVEAVAEAIISIVAAAAAAEAVVVDLRLLLKPQAEGSRFAVLVVFVTLNQDIEVTILFAKIALQITCTTQCTHPAAKSLPSSTAAPPNTSSNVVHS